MRVYSYVVDRDYGFAPNPFHGVCSLATCKPDIRRLASIGDWVIGTGGARCHMSGRLVFAMRVTEAVTFDDYFGDPRFRVQEAQLVGQPEAVFRRQHLLTR